jgi:hypothetical protein
MEDFFYLVHVTNDKNYKNWEYVKTAVFNTHDQFPGAYFSLVTKYNINYINLFPGKYKLIFSVRLLEQKNYHINLTDSNGIISESNTFYPWNLNDYLKLTSDGSEIDKVNEVIFHNPVSMNYFCKVISNKLPNMQIKNDTPPNLSYEPFYCYPFEDIQYGMRDRSPPSSLEWLQMMADTCKTGLKGNETRCDIISSIKKNSEHLYNNRSEQNIDSMKNYEYGFGKSKFSEHEKTLKYLKDL